jgi:hypothetical protein
MTFCFIVSTCVITQQHKSQLSRCYQSIRKFFPDTSVYIINDSPTNTRVDLPGNVTVVQSCCIGSGDQQVFKVFQGSGFDKAVIIQDSMLVLADFTHEIDRVDSVELLWYFTNHRKDWDTIREPITNITHTDLIKSRVNKDYTFNPAFVKFAMDRLNRKELWCGTLGSCCVITRKSLEYINGIVPFINTMVTYNTNRLRRVNESLFGIICHFVYPEKDFERGAIDGRYANNKLGQPTGFDDLVWCSYNKYIAKVSFNR